MQPVPSARHQRVEARGEITVGVRAGRTRLDRLFQDGSAKIRLPRGEGDPLEAVLINTAGGLTGGDRLDWQVSVGAGAAAVVTTQACEKVYRSVSGRAGMGCAIEAGAGARIAWLPQETILFEASALARSIVAGLAPDAEGLFVEATLFGRRAMGESPARLSFHDRWRISRGGRLVHAEDFRVDGESAALLARAAAGRGACAFATVLLVADDAAERLDAVRAIVGEGGGASAWTVAGSGKLLARLAAVDGYALRRRLVPLLTLLNGRAGLPKAWSL